MKTGQTCIKQYNLSGQKNHDVCTASHKKTEETSVWKDKEDKQNKEQPGNEKKDIFYVFDFSLFGLAQEKSGSTKERRGREAAMPDRTYSSPPFSPCAPFCTVPWVWLSGPGPRPRPQKLDLARPFLHRGDKTRPRGCWGTALVEAWAAWQGHTLLEVSLPPGE